MCTDLTHIQQTLSATLGPLDVIRIVCPECPKHETCPSIPWNDESFDLSGGITPLGTSNLGATA